MYYLYAKFLVLNGRCQIFLVVVVYANSLMRVVFLYDRI